MNPRVFIAKSFRIIVPERMFGWKYGWWTLSRYNIIWSFQSNMWRRECRRLWLPSGIQVGPVQVSWAYVFAEVTVD